jgi:hypothetical protein
MGFTPRQLVIRRFGELHPSPKDLPECWCWNKTLNSSMAKTMEMSGDNLGAIFEKIEEVKNRWNRWKTRTTYGHNERWIAETYSTAAGILTILAWYERPSISHHNFHSERLEVLSYVQQCHRSNETVLLLGDKMYHTISILTDSIPQYHP